MPADTIAPPPERQPLEWVQLVHRADCYRVEFQGHHRASGTTRRLPPTDFTTLETARAFVRKMAKITGAAVLPEVL